MAPPVELKTTFRKPDFRAASRRLRNPATFTSASNRGSVTERRTSICAARWHITSKRSDSTSRAASGERMSATTSRTSGRRFSRRPLERSSSAQTSWPASRKASSTWLPMNPAPR
jgi:hypothetical protein